MQTTSPSQRVTKTHKLHSCLEEGDLTVNHTKTELWNTKTTTTTSATGGAPPTFEEHKNDNVAQR